MSLSKGLSVMSKEVRTFEGLKQKIIEGGNVNLISKNKIYTFLNCYSYYVFRRNAESFNKIDGVYCDGIVFEKMVRSINMNAKRVSFDMTSIAPTVFSHARDYGESVLLIGSNAGVADRAREILISEFQGLNVIEVRNGYFSTRDERSNYIRHVLHLNPDYVIAGMGTPYQETFLSDLKIAGWKGIGFTCGGFLHQTCKKGAVYYPAIINRFNLRWAYRIWDEPKLVKRYAFYYPLSIICFYYDFLKFWIKKRIL